MLQFQTSRVVSDDKMPKKNLKIEYKDTLHILLLNSLILSCMIFQCHLWYKWNKAAGDTTIKNALVLISLRWYGNLGGTVFGQNAPFPFRPVHFSAILKLPFSASTLFWSPMKYSFRHIAIKSSTKQSSTSPGFKNNSPNNEDNDERYYILILFNRKKREKNISLVTKIVYWPKTVISEWPKSELAEKGKVYEVWLLNNETIYLAIRHE
ncbi:hypothetical protein AGLY_000231 [Aphis glycines]|uniref:Uncharacterized protein n=1 Tax=Aphis glycines TaxID=307491 RepID=A0A6G0U7V3_APHGL|nr:hypothetical protein AGLY_000231 [Aphis glycines]